MVIIMQLNIEKARQLYREAEDRIFNTNLTEFPGHDGKLIKISSQYSGIWLEHSYDALLFAKLYPDFSDVAISQASCFLENQLDNGHLPALVRDLCDSKNKGKNKTNFCQIQECVSFGNICYETYLLTENKEFLSRAYKSLCKWDAWLCNNRMTLNKGLIELFCEYDTGHDNALRLYGLTKTTPDKYGTTYEKSGFMPLISPDMNSVFYGDRVALFKMANALLLYDEAKMWQKKAEKVKEKILELLYDEKDMFFYDLDKDGNKRKYKTIMMATVFQEKLLEQKQFDMIYERYFKNEKEFYTKIPFPSTSISDKNWIKNLDGNSWNYYSQTLVALRCDFWMKHYKKENDYKKLLYTWLCAFTESNVPFGQEFDPITAQPSNCSPYYSSALLFYISAMRKLELL